MDRRAEHGAQMSSLLRRLPLSRLLLLCATVVAVAALGGALASALGNDPKPAPKPLAQAIHDALTAPQPQGFSAHVKFVNHLIEGASLQGQEGSTASNPLLSGAEGRVWISTGGQIRLELASEKGATQILYDGTTLTVYQASSNTLYAYTPPQKAADAPASPSGAAHQPPSVTQIQEAIAHLMGHVNLSGAVPTDVAGQPAYSVKISPHSNGGLLGGAELAWDANHGVPLRLAVYAKGDATPVLELSATEVSYGPVSDSVFSLSLPANVKRTKIAPPNGSSAAHRGQRPHIDAQTTGLAAVQTKLPFTLQAPSTLAGMSLHEVRLIEVNSHDAALLGYGEGLGGILVIESQAKTGQGAAQESAGSSELGLPHVSIDGAGATELPTALGTILSFQSGGIEHILAGSVAPPVLQTAARGL
jgi:outer membrane lipoprotein-sorting protein